MKTLLRAIIAVICIALFAWLLRQHRSQHPLPHGVAPVPPSLQIVNGGDDVIAAHHPLTATGLHTKRELLAFIAKHAAWYTGFDADSATITKTVDGFWAYTMYRTGEHAQWTRKMIFIPAGTEIWADKWGNLVRVACGNPLSVVPQTAPTPEELAQLITPPAETPLIPGESLPVPQSDAPPIVVPPSDGPVYPVPCCFVIFPAPPASPVGVSEPSMWPMLLGGWGFVLITYRIFRGRRS